MFNGAAGKIFRIGGKDMRSAFDEMNASAARIDGAEILGQGVTADFGEGSGEFHSGRPAADDHEI